MDIYIIKTQSEFGEEDGFWAGTDLEQAKAVAELVANDPESYNLMYVEIVRFSNNSEDCEQVASFLVANRTF